MATPVRCVLDVRFLKISLQMTMKVIAGATAFRSNKISMAIDIAQPFPCYTSRTVAVGVLCLFRSTLPRYNLKFPKIVKYRLFILEFCLPKQVPGIFNIVVAFKGAIFTATRCNVLNIRMLQLYTISALPCPFSLNQ
ncbi:AAC_collapsed_G0004930.mRNA.1.CDS.1 [Saccharomyces cerevisiae]|nr:AAC_HP1_G0007220.mRNA.1.CDS.1 [Saccharomyces cerevisiae]CAI6512344.1 AAC_collapsed_G0004930.mRNA.1.CDS.1 [Saccharomyces cerevisiae]